MELFQPRFDQIGGQAEQLTDQQIDELFNRGVVECIPKEQFLQSLKSGKRMRFYIGADPTRPDLHIGHAVILRFLAKMQEYGHEIIFLIGDFTARIGDPTGKDATRVAMTVEEVLKNAETYKEQVQQIIDFSEDSANPARLLLNSEWLEELSFADVMQLASEFTVQQMLERDMFENRMRDGKPIYVHEFFYPMMQGYDSLAMNVDVEVGGTDQLFNMLAGRTLLKSHAGKEKAVVTFDLLLGLDGRKMSKSYDNYVGITDAPAEMYGKVMAVNDELIESYFRLCTNVTLEEIAKMEQARVSGEAHPRDLKMQLARELVTLYHGAEAAEVAEVAFVQQFQKKERPDEMPEVAVQMEDDGQIGVLTLIVTAGLAASNGEARRLVRQGGVRLNDERIEDEHARVHVANGDVLQVGKRNFVKCAVTV